MRKVIKNDVTCTNLILINLNIKKTIIISLRNILASQFPLLSITLDSQQKLHSIISIFSILKSKDDESYRTHDHGK